MKSKIKYSQTNESLKIEIFPKPKKILEYGFWAFYVLPLFLIGSIMLFEFLDKPKLNLETLVIIVFAILYFLSLKVMFNKFYSTETVEISSSTMFLTEKNLFQTKTKEFDRNKIQNLKYGSNDQFTSHQLSTKNFDYLGFDTGEKEVQFFIESGKINFEYLGQIINFGKNVFEYDGTEIIEKIKKY